MSYDYEDEDVRPTPRTLTSDVELIDHTRVFALGHIGDSPTAEQLGDFFLDVIELGDRFERKVI